MLTIKRIFSLGLMLQYEIWTNNGDIVKGMMD